MSPSRQPSQKELLLSLIQGSQGRMWASDMVGWSPNAKYDVCFWDGIICENQSVVVGLTLTKKNFIGTLPTELGQMTTLREIDMPNNLIRGTIPTEISNLPNLEIINLSDNDLTGTFPLFKSKALQSLDLSNNRITGTLPLVIGFEKKKMKDFDVMNNNLTGPIPSTFSMMSELDTLSLSGNRFSGTIPSTLGRLTSLSFLYLDNNRLMGTIPTLHDTELEELWLMGNMLSGTIPSSYADLDKLFNFYIDGNKITGTIPEDLCKPNMNADFYKDLDLNSNNNSSDDRPCDSVACPIDHVSPNGVYPCTKCPPHLQNPYIGRTGDRCIDTDQDGIIETFLESVVGLDYDPTIPSCKYVGITCDNNDNVVSLSFKNVGLRGTIPPELGFLRFLKELDLSDNELTGYVPSDLKFAPLERFDVTNNRLKGVVPESLCFKAGMNGNGLSGEFSCTHVACPMGTFSESGRGSSTSSLNDDEGTTKEKCNACASAIFLGSTFCNRGNNGGAMASSSSEIHGPATTTTVNVGLLTLTVIISFFIVGVVVLISYLWQRQQQRGEEEKRRSYSTFWGSLEWQDHEDMDNDFGIVPADDKSIT